MSPVLQAHFADYAAFHGTLGNKICHYVGIPLIVLTLFSFLAQAPLFAVGGVTVTLAEIVLLVVTLYYLSLDATLGLLMFVTSAVLALVGRRLSMPVAAALFVLGWVFQFAGHYIYEKRSPAFFRNLTHLLIGPLWIVAKATRRA